MATLTQAPSADTLPATRARPAEQIVAGIVNARGREAKRRRKLSANRERNWLLALTLNSFSKLGAGQRLTDLETGLVDAYRANGYTDRELAAQGKLYDQLPP